MAYSFGKKDLGCAAAAEIEVDGSKADSQTVVLIPSAKPSEHTAHEDADETNTPEPNQSKNCGRLSIVLDYSERLQ